MAAAPALARPPVLAVVSQHVEEAAHLRHVRSVLVRAPHVRLHQLRRLDDRIAAHLDGIAVAGVAGQRLCEEGLASPSAGVLFTLAVGALERHDEGALQRLFAICQGEPRWRAGLLSALGWVSATQLRGTIRDLLASGDATRRGAGLVACAMHGVDPGPALDAALLAEDTPLRTQARRVAAVAGRPGGLPAVSSGDGAEATALRLKALDLSAGRAHLQALAGRGDSLALRRRLVRDSGTVGDPQAVPWLISLMSDDRWARLAGEAFTTITGADLAAQDLERKPPEGVDFGPGDDPTDSDVALDEDDGLPWPDATRVTAWWSAEQGRFPAGRRCFMGAEPTPANLPHLLQVLREGGQRQREAAAQWRSVLVPGTPLFPTRAPAWRQQRWLAALADPANAG